MPPSSLRDEYHVRYDPLEREAQTLHLLCLNFDRLRRNGGQDYEAHIAEIKKRLERIRDHKIGLIEK